MKRMQKSRKHDLLSDTSSCFCLQTLREVYIFSLSVSLSLSFSLSYIDKNASMFYCVKCNLHQNKNMGREGSPYYQKTGEKGKKDTNDTRD